MPATKRNPVQPVVVAEGSYEESFPSSGKLRLPRKEGEGIAMLKDTSGEIVVVLDSGAFRFLVETLQSAVRSQWTAALPAAHAAGVRALTAARTAAEAEGLTRASQLLAGVPAPAERPAGRRGAPEPVSVAVIDEALTGYEASEGPTEPSQAPLEKAARKTAGRKLAARQAVTRVAKPAKRGSQARTGASQRTSAGVRQARTAAVEADTPKARSPRRRKCGHIRRMTACEACMKGRR